MILSTNIESSSGELPARYLLLHAEMLGIQPGENTMSDTASLAELLRQDDTLRFKLFAQKVLVQEDARITVEVHSLVSTSQNDRKSLEQRIRAALNAFIPADWAFSTIQRGGEAVGYERVTLNASARIAIAEVYNLEERARQASAEGLSLKEPKINYSLPSQRVTDTVQELRRKIVDDAKRQIEEFDESTGRTWRIGDIAFGLWDNRGEYRTGKGAYRASDDAIADLLSEADDAGMTSAERITLVADVTLRAAA
jgi:hypothetical protein